MEVSGLRLVLAVPPMIPSGMFQCRRTPSSWFAWPATSMSSFAQPCRPGERIRASSVPASREAWSWMSRALWHLAAFGRFNTIPRISFQLKSLPDRQTDRPIHPFWGCFFVYPFIMPCHSLCSFDTTVHLLFPVDCLLPIPFTCFIRLTSSLCIFKFY